MTNKEYFKQAYRLDQRINSDIEEVRRLREMAVSISSPQSGDRVQTSKRTEAPFEKSVLSIMALEAKIDEEVDTFVALKKEMREIISTLKDPDERMVLRYRYVHGFTWEQIGNELNADERTVRRWHGTALAHVVLPENPIKI